MRRNVAIVCASLVVLLGAASDRAESQCGGSPPCVDSADIVDGQVKTADLGASAVTAPKLGASAVTNAKLATDAVTGAKVLNGSLGEQDISVHRRIVVAKNGGDFSTISAALASIGVGLGGLYWVVDVMPGTYVENVVMKSRVHLRGAGVDQVTIQSSGCSLCNVVELINLVDVEISGVTVTGAPAGATGIYVEDGSGIKIRGNVVRGNGTPSAPAYGIYVRDSGDFTSAEPFIVDNYVHSNRCYGIALENSVSVNLLRNYVVGNQSSGCTGSGADIFIVSGAPHISYNVVDSIDGSGGFGFYNITSFGFEINVP